jgi:hypothetical protein
MTVCGHSCNCGGEAEPMPDENYDHVKNITDKLLDMTYNNDNWEYVQDECIKYLENENYDIVQLAIICLGHIATFHNNIDKEKVLPILYKKMQDKELIGVVEDALDDIKMFVK